MTRTMLIQGGTTLTVTVGVQDPGGVTALSCTDGSSNVASISNASASPQITQDVTLKSGSHSISCTGTGSAANQGTLTQSFYVKKTLSIVVGGGTDHHGVTTLSAQLSDDQGNAVNGKTVTFSVDDNGTWKQVASLGTTSLSDHSEIVTDTEGEPLWAMPSWSVSRCLPASRSSQATRPTPV